MRTCQSRSQCKEMQNMKNYMQQYGKKCFAEHEKEYA
jgi:hypothetical protein